MCELLFIMVLLQKFDIMPEVSLCINISSLLSNFVDEGFKAGRTNFFNLVFNGATLGEKKLESRHICFGER